MVQSRAGGAAIRYATLVVALSMFLLADAGSAIAQQNLFNVPSADITDPGMVFFQEQVNFSSIGTFNTTVDFGLGNQWEAGLNFVDLEFYDRSTGPSTGQVNPDLLFNVQKGFTLNEAWSFGLGTQVGFNPSRHPENTELLSFSWLTGVFKVPDDRGKLYVGSYCANHPFRGDGQSIGYMLGADLPIFKDKLDFMADYISGTSDISNAVVGGVAFLPSTWQVSLGAQIPSPGSHNSYGVVLEFTQTDLLRRFRGSPPPDKAGESAAPK